jgi:PKD repeat protein
LRRRVARVPVKEDRPVAEQKESGGKLRGWLKAAVGTFVGLCSGAAVMYITPLVDKAIKPAKPLANFEIAPEGLTVRFHNLSNAGQGWWDFGDGSQLEAVKSEGEYVTHTFPQAGDYSVKLSVQNIINEGNERSVTVKVGAGAGSGDTAQSTDPKVDSLEVIPVNGSFVAPATFRVLGKVENAQLCVWDLSDEQPLEVVPDSPDARDRTVTFTKPGGYKIRLAAVNGTRQQQKSELVVVMPPPPGVISAVLTVTDCGFHHVKESNLRTPPFSVSFPPNHTGDTYEFKRPLKAKPGCSIADLVVKTAADKSASLNGRTAVDLDVNALGLHGVQDLKLSLDADRQTVWLTGKLVRQGHAPPSLMLWTEMTELREVAANQPNVPVMQSLGLPGSGMPTTQTLTLPKQQGDWTDLHRQISLQLLDAGTVIWQGAQLPASAVATVQGRRVIVNVTRLNDQQVQISLVDAANLGALKQ